MRAEWVYMAAGLSLVVIPIVMALNGGADSPTVLYLLAPADRELRRAKSTGKDRWDAVLATAHISG